MLSVAKAVTATEEPETDVELGAVIDTVGAVVSELDAELLTVTLTGAEVV